MRTLLAAMLLIVMNILSSAAAREIESWPYDRLFKEADIVVIAAAQKSIDSDDVPPDGPWKRSLVGQRTNFAVISTLKGKLADGPLTVMHFRLKDGVSAQNGPMLVRFRTHGLHIEGGGRVKYNVVLDTPQYLMFLRRTSGGRYEPVSGQIDSERSVKEIYSPLPADMDQASLKRNGG